MEYLALEGGPPSFTRGFTGPMLLWYANHNGEHTVSPTGLSPCIVSLSRLFGYRCFCNSGIGARNPGSEDPVWASPLSLAATYGVSVDFLSCRYLDVSVPCVRPDGLCIQPAVTSSACTVTTGCPIRKSQDQSLFDGSPGHIAAYHVLHRLITPRHPPYTLNSLITFVIGPQARDDVSSCLGASVLSEPRSLLSLSLCTCQKAIQTSADQS